MFGPSREIVERIKKEYPAGTRVELIHMGDDPNPVPDHTKGTVLAVDDIASVHVRFDSGRHLGLVYGEDVYRKIEEVAV